MFSLVLSGVSGQEDYEESGSGSGSGSGDDYGSGGSGSGILFNVLPSITNQIFALKIKQKQFS